jgi:hypothetical protein
LAGERIPPRPSVKSLFTLLTQHRPYDSRWEAQAIRLAFVLYQGHMSAIPRHLGIDRSFTEN